MAFHDHFQWRNSGEKLAAIRHVNIFHADEMLAWFETFSLIHTTSLPVK